METTEENVGEVETEETTPEEKVTDFATAIADSAKKVASGEMTAEDFIAESMTMLEDMKAMTAPTDGGNAMGGLGQDSGKFPLPAPEPMQ